MSQERFPLRINVGFLLNQPIGSSRDFHFDFPILQLQDFRLNHLIGQARFGRTAQGLLVQAEFQAEVIAECVRCLAEFMQPIRTSFSELYAFKARDMTDSGLLVPEDAKIDLSYLVREYLLLEVPISPLCRMDCKGLCAQCGVDLNVAVCEHYLAVS